MDSTNSNSTSNTKSTSTTQDGITIFGRFNKAIETVMLKHSGDIVTATAELEGICKSKFGWTLAELDAVTQKKEFWKLAIQKRRHEHLMAEKRKADEALKGTVNTEASELRRLLSHPSLQKPPVVAASPIPESFEPVEEPVATPKPSGKGKGKGKNKK